MSGIEVFPLYGFGGLVVVADVAHELSLQVKHRSAHTAHAHITLDLGELPLDLVESGRVGRSAVQMHIAMTLQELLEPLGLVSREAVGDHTDLFAARLVRHDSGEKGDELHRSMPRRGLAEHFASPGVERSGIACRSRS